MKIINPSEYPEFSRHYEEAQNFHVEMVNMGQSTYQIGPVCSRDYAWALEDLKDAAERFLEKCEEPHGDFVCEVMKREYRKAKQELHSQLKHF